MLLRKYRFLPFMVVLAWGLSWGCAQTEVRLGDEIAQDAGPSFTEQASGDAKADAGLDAATTALLCIGTSCPAPFATCASEEGPAYKCGTDLAHDPNNCGACGNKCLVYKPLRMTSRCVNGACELECMNDPFRPTDRRNCNGEVDDGCEVDVLTDPENCGACGKACGAGQPCIKGKCGCPANQIACPSGPGPNDVRCVDPKTDDENCGGCGVICEPPKGACDPMPERAYYGCMQGTCGNLKCAPFTRDCNNDVSPNSCGGDGCEVADVRTDRKNCGGCGIACQPGEECIDEGNGPECAVPCSRFNKVLCPQTGQCVDLLSDPDNCGGCGNYCKPSGPNQVRACDKGLCAYDCAPGFADCNGDSTDGCETNLRSHPGNCGACGNRCDIAAGQPCIEGKCLMTTCDPGTTK